MTELTSSLMGVNITQTPDANKHEHALGTRVDGVDGTEWLYVLAGGVITQYDTVGIDENSLAQAITTAMAADGHGVGFAQVAFASGDYGWVATRGTNIQARLAISCAADVPLYTTSTAGVLDDTATGGSIAGVVSVETITAATNAEIIATFPRSNQF